MMYIKWKSNNPVEGSFTEEEMQMMDNELYTRVMSAGTVVKDGITYSLVSNKGNNDGGNYDDKGNSEHYKASVIEYVDAQCRLYGHFLAYALCFMQADKYRSRAGKKAGVSFEKDKMKMEWYEACASYLKDVIDYSRVGVIPQELIDAYGGERFNYIKMPYSLSNLLAGELGINPKPIKTLSEVVNKKLGK